MLISSLMLIAGLVLLPFAADFLVRGSVEVARRLKVPHLIIGLTIVALGTSAPELVTSIVAALKGAPGIALGNAVGSNIANLGLVLGGAALLGRIPVQRRLVGFDHPVMLGVMALTWLLAMNGLINRWEGIVMVAALIGITIWTIKRGGIQPEEAEEAAKETGCSNLCAGLLLAGGLTGLAVGAELLVRGATNLATAFGVSNTVVGVTIVALGTSLPEVAAAFAAARQKRYSILVGSLIGSNTYNLAAIVGIPAAICPLKVDPSMLSFHLPALAVISVVAWLLLWTSGMVKRREGAILLSLYVAYILITLWRS